MAHREQRSNREKKKPKKDKTKAVSVATLAFSLRAHIEGVFEDFYFGTS
jgi:hypothetical protein